MKQLKTSLRFRIIFMLDVLLLLLVQILQGSALNYFFITQFEEYFTTYFLFILDFFCLSVFIGTFILSYNYFTHKDRSERIENQLTNKISKRWLNFKWGALPMCYISWLIYASILIGKLSVIFGNQDGYKQKPEMLEICMGTSSIVFMFLVEGHNWHKKSSESYSFVTDMCKKVGVEIFDSVEMLELLITTDQLSRTMENVIFSLASANFLLPTLCLYQLSMSNFGKNVTPQCLPVRILHNLIRVGLIDIPFFIVRMRSWLIHRELSIFMVKNLFYIVMAVRELYLDIFMYFRPLPTGKKTSTVEEIPLSNEQTQTDGSKANTHV